MDKTGRINPYVFHFFLGEDTLMSSCLKNDMLMWLMDETRKKGHGIDMVVLYLLIVEFTAIHTTAMVRCFPSLEAPGFNGTSSELRSRLIPTGCESRACATITRGSRARPQRRKWLESVSCFQNARDRQFPQGVTTIERD